MTISTETAALILRADATQVDAGGKSLDNLTASAGKADNAAKKLGETSAQESARVAAAMGKVRAQQAEFSRGLDANGKSAKELQFAMRNLPAQLTDISVGLASGQSPMLVLLQQGGQLKDMFGGIGPAAKALGSSLIGLVNPYTLAAAGAGALLLAWKQGSDEAIAYNRSLILTGSYAGLTAGQLQAMAANVSGVSGTMHEAASALAEVAGSGKFTASQIQLVGSAAVAVSQMTGEATGKTIKQFQELAERPVEAILKLNDTQHFLTLSTYEQIKALEDEGRAQDAASLAMQVYSKALNDRRAEVVNNAGLMEQAWHGITGAAKGAWDAMLDVGRQESGQDKFDALARVRERLVSERDKGIKFDLNSGRDINAAINAVTAQMAAMQDARITAEKEASKKATDAALVQIAADSDREAAQFATNAQKLVAEKLKAKNKADDDYAKAVAAGDMKLAEKIRKNEAIILAGIEDKYKDKTPARKTADPFGSLNGLVQGAQVKSNTFGTDGQTSQITSILAIVDAGAKLIASGQDIATVQAKVAVGVAAVNDLYAKQAAQIKSQNVVALDQYREAVNNKLAADKMQLDNQVARIGMGQQEYERQTQLNKVYQDYARVIENLQKQRAQKGANTALIDGQIAAQSDARDIAVAQTVASFDAIDKAQGDWLLGAQSAYKDYLASASDVAGQSASLFASAFDGMSNSLANFVTTGKGNFKGLATSIIGDLAKMELRVAESKILQSILSAFMGGTVDNSAAGAGSVSAGLGDGQWSGFAKGDVFSGSPSLSAYSGQVVNSPTPFLFASGAGIMGEAGPEAIMPLKRGSDGKLGVVAQGGGGVQLSQTFVIDSNGQSSDNTSGAANDDAMRQFSQRMKDVAKQTIMEEQRQGGSLWRMQH